MEAPPIVDWKSAHPLLRYGGFDNVQVVESLTARTPTWAVSLVEAPQSPLILAGELGRQRIIWIGFDVLQSNWPLRVSFPDLHRQRRGVARPGEREKRPTAGQGGRPVPAGAAGSAGGAQVTLPDGTTRSLKIDPTANELVFGDTYKEGVYRLRLGTNDTVFCVNLLDAAESNIKPRDELQLGKYTKVSRDHNKAGEHGAVAHYRGAGSVGAAGGVVVLPSEDGVRDLDSLRLATFTECGQRAG